MTLKRNTLGDGEAATAAGIAQTPMSPRMVARKTTAMQVLLDTMTPVSHGTSEQHRRSYVLSHRRDSREFQLQIRYRWAVRTAWSRLRAR
jgi:hypothetical protein